MYATPKELIAAFRNLSRDTVEDYLWSDAELYQYATQAEAEVASRLLCLNDMTTDKVAVLSVDAGAPDIAMHPSIIRVKSAFLIQNNEQRSLVLSTMDGMRNARVFTETGRPHTLIFGGSTGFMRLYPIPTEAGTLQLTVVRTPLKPLSDTSTKFEIPYHYTTALIEWMRYRAYGKLDSDSFDPGQSSAGMAAFMSIMEGYKRMESLKTGGLKDGTVAYGGI